MKIALSFVVLVVAAAAETPQPGGQLRLALQAEPKTLDPILAADEPSELVRYLTGGALIRLNRKTQALEPALAMSWSLGSGGTRLSLVLRKGVRFSDGTPFSAEDVCHTFRRLTDPKLDSPLGEAFRSVKGGTRCVVEGGNVALQFGEPLIGVERLLDDVAIESRAGGREKAVLGPFVVAEQKAGSYLLLARNPNYWKKDERGTALPYLDSIRLEIQRNRDFELMRFRRSEFDIVNNLGPEAFDRLKAERAGSVHELGVSLDSEQMWFNQVASAPLAAHKKEWFRSRAFRLAVSEAIRRADLARVVYRGHATPAAGPVSPANRFWVNPLLKAPAGDPQAALARLEKAGFQLKDGVLRDGKGNAVEFSLITNSGNRNRERMMAMIRQDMSEIGIKVSPVPLDFPSLIERITKTFDYDACLLGLVHSDLDPIGEMNVWLSSGAQHQWNPNQAKPETEWEAAIDREMHQLASQTDPGKRKQAFDRVQQTVAEQVPFIYLIHTNALVAASPAVRGLAPAVLRPQTLWNAEQLWLASGKQVSQK